MKLFKTPKYPTVKDGMDKRSCIFITKQQNDNIDPCLLLWKIPECSTYKGRAGEEGSSPRSARKAKELENFLGHA